MSVYNQMLARINYDAHEYVLWLYQSHCEIHDVTDMKNVRLILQTPDFDVEKFNALEMIRATCDYLERRKIQKVCN